MLHLPKACVTVTEFHDPRDVISLVTADDADDAATPNGRVRFSISAGNQDGAWRGGKIWERLGIQPAGMGAKLLVVKTRVMSNWNTARI